MKCKVQVKQTWIRQSWGKKLNLLIFKKWQKSKNFRKHKTRHLYQNIIQVYTETLNSRYLKAEKASQNDIVGCVIPLMKVSLLTKIRKITERQTFWHFRSAVFSIRRNIISSFTKPSVSYTYDASKCLMTFLYKPETDIN